MGPLAKLLAPSRRVIIYQLRGEDDSFALRRPFGLNDLGRDLGNFLDCLCLERPMVFGFSFGGVVALDFAVQHPGRVGQLAVQGVGARFEPSLIQQVARTVLSRFPLPPDSAFVNQFFNLLFGQSQGSNALSEFVVRQIWQTDQGMMAHRLGLIETYNLDDQLGRIRAPTLILAGEKDVVVSARSLQNLSEGIPGAKLVKLLNCGHLASITHASVVAEELLRFAN
ncbi:MAG: alpha/beta hydrolase [Gemmataceae bacterium]|nr:alpha/beta hydrolase [Gemmataceae bacterium]